MTPMRYARPIDPNWQQSKPYKVWILVFYCPPNTELGPAMLAEAYSSQYNLVGEQSEKGAEE
jgi:hypothetical protein